MANCSRTTHPTGPQCHHPSIPLPISPPPTPKNLCPFRKLIPPSPRLYRQDHSRGRGLTTTGQPTVSSLPQKSNFFSVFNDLQEDCAGDLATQSGKYLHRIQIFPLTSSVKMSFPTALQALS